MSNLIVNIRVAYWHFQVQRDRPWISVSLNRYWWDRGVGLRDLIAFY